MDEKEQKELEEKLKKSKEKSLAALMDNIKVHETSLRIQEEKKALLQDIFKISKEHLKMLNPEREFQKLDEYWSLMKKWEELEHEHRMLGIDAEINRTKKVMEETKKQYDQINQGGNDGRE